MLGEYIRIERLKKGLSQENMAHMLNISQAAYSKIESEKTIMALPRLYQIAKILELDMNEILKEAQWSMVADLNLLEKWWLNIKIKYRKFSWLAKKMA
nr:helix-turn-helix transcriptional regulator [Pseudopedobacter sp.]